MTERREFGMVINGNLCAASSGETLPCINPTSGEIWATVPNAAPGDVDSALAAAREAFSSEWSSYTGYRRGRLLTALADELENNKTELARMETTDNGKVIRETERQVVFAARVFRYYAGYADKLYGDTIPLDDPRIFDYTILEPKGVVALLTAWNSPIALLANKLPAALATGNTVVIKPSEHASATTTVVADLLGKAGMPPGVVNVVTGGPEVGARLISSPELDGISLTGGVETGRQIAKLASNNLTPLTLELGGKSPNIIFEDAPFPMAITGALAGIFAAAGQTCVAGSRLLVQDTVLDKVVTQLAKAARAITVGDPLDPTTQMGPVGNEAHRKRILAMIRNATAQGAEVLTGGGELGPDEPYGAGCFIEPTILSNVTADMQIACEEVFGPVLAVVPFSSDEEAVAIANRTEFGLAAGIWTIDPFRIHTLPRRLKAGVVWVNTYRTNAAQAPFGGTRNSGYGRERGWQGLLEYVNVKNVMVDTDPGERDPFAIRT